ncbi:uncharacterized protein LOC133381148 [Rhineura floridana]|uniref:uncharacterized protein LOC133381148 n=1 Tax=Rhineura floridana TaxID=261503 RepID=UPI002AC7EB1E|nr:uncharacterized protein LOC133381148 [Rhineura floridana]
MEFADFLSLVQLHVQLLTVCLVQLRDVSLNFMRAEQEREEYEHLMQLQQSRNRLMLLRAKQMKNRRKYSCTPLQMFAAMAHCTFKRNIPRSVWVRDRSRSWWETEVLKYWDDDLWLANFRMTRATLSEIADLLRPHLERQGTNMRNAIPVEKRLAITVWWLATLECYREVAVNFGVGKSTVGDIVVEVCLAIEHVLLSRTVNIGQHQEIMDGFMSMGFPQVVGVVDGCHIPIMAPTGQGKVYINRKGFYSILLQGTCDHTGRFINIEVGWSGKNHDSFVFRNSAIYQAMDAGVFVPENPSITIGGVQVPPLILADADYPMYQWLMKPYGGQLDNCKMGFNRVFNRCRNVVQRSFGRLKSRWSRLTARLPVAEENFVSVVTSCVVLHNICETKGHIVHELFDLSDELELPAYGEQSRRNDNRDACRGNEVRAAIAQFIMDNNF